MFFLLQLPSLQPHSSWPAVSLLLTRMFVSVEQKWVDSYLSRVSCFLHWQQSNLSEFPLSIYITSQYMFKLNLVFLSSLYHGLLLLHLLWDLYIASCRSISVPFFPETNIDSWSCLDVVEMMTNNTIQFIRE